MDKIKCEYCGKEYSKKGMGTHIWRNHGDGKTHNPNKGYQKGIIEIWNKGKSKQNHPGIKSQSEKILGHESWFEKHSEKSKKKISKIRRAYLEKYPDKVPYRLNHSFKKSYPEELFEKELIKRNISGWIYNYPMGIYQYDFAWPDLKIDVEIDGATHNQEKVKRIDERRDKFSTENGWKVIRFSASMVKKEINLCFDELQKYLK